MQYVGLHDIDTARHRGRQMVPNTPRRMLDDQNSSGVFCARGAGAPHDLYG